VKDTKAWVLKSSLERPGSLRHTKSLWKTERALQGKNFVIATGRRAGIPPVEGLDGVPYFTNETIFDELDERPNRLIVLGGGHIGCELGQTFGRLGCEVTLLEFLPRIMIKEDEYVSQFIRQQIEAEGVRVLTSCSVQHTAYNNGEVVLQADIQPGSGNGTERLELKADALLVAAGRIPNVVSLDLEAAGVAHGKQGVEVNEFLQTSQKHIYASGDIVGPYQFTHMADAQARVVIRNILMPINFLRQKMDYSVIPWGTYTSPEVARVGMSETEAKAGGISYDVFWVNLGEKDRAIVESQETGFVKVLARAGGDKLLGAVIVGHHAGDLLHEFVLAMKQEVGLAGLSNIIHAYPTFAELARKVGDVYNRNRLTSRALAVFRWMYGT
jgi:pyruvate/2-oxoglutarate dehydrogenase complex dihydrolipoamide dehydrogenase (E3) component